MDAEGALASRRSLGRSVAGEWPPVYRGQNLVAAKPIPPPRDLIVRLSPKGEIMGWGPMGESLVGYAADEIVGCRIDSIIAEPVPPESSTAIASLRSGQPVKFETLLRRKDGTLVEVEIDARPPVEGQGSPAAIIRDLTDACRARRVNQQNEERLRLALSAAEIGAYEIDLLTQRYSLDARAAAIWGRDPTEVICYDSFAAQALEEDRPSAEAALIAAGDPRGDGGYQVELRIRRQNDGAIRWVALRGRTFFECGRPITRIGVMLDVTERKRAEEANAHLAAIIGASEDAIYSLDLEGAVLSWNAAAERVFGAKADAMIGYTDLILVPDDRARFRRGE